MSNINGLTEVTRVNRGHHIHKDWCFDKGDVRKAMQKIYSPGKDYVLFKTTANQEAAKVLRKYIGFRDNMESPWIVRKIQVDDHPRYVPGAHDKGNGLRFDNSLMDSYQCAIDKMADELIGKDIYASYSMVSTSGVHNLERDPNAIFWPRIYIVDAGKEKQLKAIIDNLVSDESFEVLKEVESSTAYQMGEIETLNKLGIRPIVRLPQEIRVGADDLLAYIDFLAQMTETYKWRGPVFEDI